MRRRYRQQGLYVIFLLFLVLSVGFAALNSNLVINGTTKIKGNTWDIHFNNVEVHPGSVSANMPVIDSTNKTSVSFDTTLSVPGEFYMFTVDVVNAGSIDAMVDSVNLNVNTSEYYDCYVLYENGNDILTKDFLAAGSKRKIEIMIRYKDDVLSSTDININLNLSLTYVQADDSALKVRNFDLNNNGVIDTGDMFSLGSERFYVLSNDGENVRALAEWNLLVGNEYDGNMEHSATPLNNPTGLQSKYAKGFVDYEVYRKGTIPFSTDDVMGNTSTDYVGSLVEEYVNVYRNTLSQMGTNILEATILDESEIYALLGLDYSNKVGNNVLEAYVDNSYKWLRNTFSWTKTKGISDDTILALGTSGSISSVPYTNDYGVGVRPVITVSAKNL